MRVIFEDNEDKLLSKLFMGAYPDEISKTFKYSRGNRNMMNTIHEIFDEKSFKESDEKVVVFIDLVPDNTEAIEVYNDLLGKCHIFYPGRVVVIPIVCAEYYLIKSIHNTNLIRDQESVDICLSQLDYKQAPCAELANNEKEYKSFEKFCKLVKDKCLKECISSDGRSTEQYLEKDCSFDCRSRCADSSCKKIYSKLQKSLDLLVEYPIVPNGSFHTNKKEISYEEVEQIRLELLNELIEFEKRLIKSGKTTKKEIWRSVKC